MLCLVSGILLWKEARNNNRYPADQKRFHRRVTRIFLAVCFALFPATAILFSAELLLPATDHVLRVNTIFFLSWLFLSLAAMLLPSERAITRFSLWTGGLFSLLVPVVNGSVTGDWLWKTPIMQVWATDLFWLAAGLLSFSVYRFTRLPESPETKASVSAPGKIRMTKQP